MKRIIPIVVACVVAVTVGAQTPTQKPASDIWGIDTYSIEKSARIFPTLTDEGRKKAEEDKIIETLAKAHGVVAKRFLDAGRTGNSESAVRYAMDQYFSQRGSAESSTQVSALTGEAQMRMEMVQIGQNQRIIELLEKLAAKK